VNPWLIAVLAFILGNLFGIFITALLTVAGDMDRVAQIMSGDGSLEPTPPGYGPQAFNVVGDWGEPHD